MRDEPLQPGLAVDQLDGEPIHIPPELARELIETDAGVGREWRRWKGIGGDRGLVLLLRPCDTQTQDFIHKRRKPANSEPASKIEPQALETTLDWLIAGMCELVRGGTRIPA